MPFDFMEEYLTGRTDLEPNGPLLQILDSHRQKGTWSLIHTHER